MNAKNQNLLLRVVSALVLLPVVLFLLVKGGFFFACLIAFAAGVCTSEYYGITQRPLSPLRWLGVGVAGALPLLIQWKPALATAVAFWLVAGFFFAAWAYHLIRGPLAEAPTLAAHAVTGVLYGGVGLFALAVVRNGDRGFEWVMCALIITWMNDTAAYFAGRFLGRHKLYPAVSPNKTWEGFGGGMIGSVGGLFLHRALLFPALTPLDCVLLGVAGGIVGPIGDLCESMLKRAYGAKDSGKILPGHGGLLDRIDALLFNAPLVLAYAHWLRHLLP